MPSGLRQLTYRPEVVKTVRKLGLSSALRRAYFHFSRPANGILETEIVGVPMRFRVRTPEELRILESAGGAGGEQRVMASLREILRPGDVALDVGANVGLYTVLLAKAVGPNGSVIACEPARLIAEHLKENLELNGFDNVRVFQKALGEAPGRARLYASTVIGNSSLAEAQGSGEAEDVEVIEGDYLIASESLPIPRAVKIDVEGFEYAVLRGLQQTISDKACQLVACEVHPSLLPKGVEPDDIRCLLESCGFRQFETFARWDGTFHLVAL